MAFSRPLNFSAAVASTDITYCRFCGKQSIGRSIINLQNDAIYYKAVLKKLAYMNIKPARKLHMNICQSCYKSLNKSYGFCLRFNHTQVHLANIYGAAEQDAITERARQTSVANSGEDIDADGTEPINRNKNQFSDLGKTWNHYKWTCCHCDTKYRELSRLRDHSKRRHDICFGFECPDCDIRLNEYDQFIAHVRLHKVNLRFFCDVCNNPTPLNGCHDHKQGSPSCRCCGEVFPDDKAFFKHQKEFKQRPKQRRKGNPGSYIITVPDLQMDDVYPQCDAFQSWSDYVWACSECDMRFHSVASIREHSQTVHDVCFTSKCIDCNATTKEFHQLILHIMRHRLSLRHFCPFCDCISESDERFRCHVQNHLTNSSYCAECGQIYNERLSEPQPRNLTSVLWFLEPPGIAVNLQERVPAQPLVQPPPAPQPPQAAQPPSQPAQSAAQPTERPGPNVPQNGNHPQNRIEESESDVSSSISSDTDDDSSSSWESEREDDEDTDNPAEEVINPPPAFVPENAILNRHRVNNVIDDGDDVEDVIHVPDGVNLLQILGNIIENPDPLQARYALQTPLACGACMERFSDKRLYREHTQITFCLICDKAYSCSKRRNEHLFTVHMAEKPFECYKCGKCYYKRDSAYDCMLTHLNEQTSMCTICKSMVLKSFLAEHTEAHRYECSRKDRKCMIGYCNQKFESWVDLVNHRYAKHLTITFRKVRTNSRYMAQKTVGLLPDDVEE